MVVPPISDRLLVSEDAYRRRYRFISFWFFSSIGLPVAVVAFTVISGFETPGAVYGIAALTALGSVLLEAVYICATSTRFQEANGVRCPHCNAWLMPMEDPSISWYFGSRGQRTVAVCQACFEEVT